MDYGKILEWQRGTGPERIAADLASQIQNGKLSKWDSLPLNRELADKWDVSSRTISRAKNLLHAHGMLTIVDRRYYVA
jgi:DNA-binding GntR family transcriptional regulator